jgi:hypothetical protein
VIEEGTQEFVKEAWTDNTLQGFSKRYMMLSKIVRQALGNNEDLSQNTRKRINRQVLILWGKTRRFPKLHTKVTRLSEDFKKYDVRRRASEADAQTQDEHN